MPTIDPQAAIKIQPELWNGEHLHWAAMPNPRVIFHADDWSSIPFSVAWLGFFIFWEASALGYGESKDGPSAFMAIWGIPFLLVGAYMFLGRFFHDAWLKRRTFYAITDRRVLIIQDGRKHSARFTYLEAIPEIVREGTGIGTLWLGAKLPIAGAKGTPKRSMSRFDMNDGIAVLADIDNVDSVHRLIDDLRAKAIKLAASSSQTFGTPPLTYR